MIFEIIEWYPLMFEVGTSVEFVWHDFLCTLRLNMLSNCDCGAGMSE